jgi:membrane protein YqaA with SNARE-associated domain
MSALGDVDRCGFPRLQLASLLLAAAVLLGVIVFSAAGYEPTLPYIGQFLTSLVAGTMLPFLPGSSEIAMAGLLATGAGAPAPLLIFAIGGTVIGATANYVIGWHLARLTERRWFPISPVARQRTSEWFRRYGIWLIVMCWLPTAGDAITLVAGLLRADFRAFLILATAGKTFGHVAVASGVGWIL